MAGTGKPPRLVNTDGTTLLRDESVELPPLSRLVRWAAGYGDDGCCAGTGDSGWSLSEIMQFPAARRFAEIRIEIAKLGSASGVSLFQPVELVPHYDTAQCLAALGELSEVAGTAEEDALNNPATSSNDSAMPGDDYVTSKQGSAISAGEWFWLDDEAVFDVLFDAQLDAMHVALKDVHTGVQATACMNACLHACARMHARARTHTHTSTCTHTHTRRSGCMKSSRQRGSLRRGGSVLPLLRRTVSSHSR